MWTNFDNFSSVLTQEDTNDTTKHNYYTGQGDNKVCTIKFIIDLFLDNSIHWTNSITGPRCTILSVIKESKEEFNKVLASFFKRSLQTGILSSGNWIMLYDIARKKVSDRSLASIDRPDSLTSAVGKVDV